VGFVRRHPFLTVLFLLVFGAFAVLGVTFLAVWRAAHHDDAALVSRADAIVVLGAAQFNGTPSPVFQGRLEQALLLYRQGKGPVVITVGSNQPGDITTEAQSGANYLVAHGVPSSSVVPIPVGHTTYESLKAAADYMKSNGMASAFLVSDPWHNLEIRSIMDNLGIRGYVSATWNSAYVSHWERFKGYVYETFAYLYYRLTGR
jgi:uncharacterized SAM-binding protein YcdF (DUF218 family)